MYIFALRPIAAVADTCNITQRHVCNQEALGCAAERSPSVTACGCERTCCGDTAGATERGPSGKPSSETLSSGRATAGQSSALAPGSWRVTPRVGPGARCEPAVPLPTTGHQLAVLGKRLDLTILKVSCNPNDSVTL